MGDPNASIPTPQPVHYRPMFASFGKLMTNSSITFVSKAALEDGLQARLGTAKKMVAVKNTRGCEPAKVLPMAQRYFLY